MNFGKDTYKMGPNDQVKPFKVWDFRTSPKAQARCKRYFSEIMLINLATVNITLSSYIYFSCFWSVSGQIAVVTAGLEKILGL